jgi:hypothetical protein
MDGNAPTHDGVAQGVACDDTAHGSVDKQLDNALPQMPAGANAVEASKFTKAALDAFSALLCTPLPQPVVHALAPRRRAKLPVT